MVGWGQSSRCLVSRKIQRRGHQNNCHRENDKYALSIQRTFQTTIIRNVFLDFNVKIDLSAPLTDILPSLAIPNGIALSKRSPSTPYE